MEFVPGKNLFLASSDLVLYTAPSMDAQSMAEICYGSAFMRYLFIYLFQAGCIIK